MGRVFAFLFRRVRRWLILTILVPLVGLVARQAAQRLEARNGGSSKVSNGLHYVGRLGQKRASPPGPPAR